MNIRTDKNWVRSAVAHPILKMKGYEFKTYHNIIAIKVDGEWKKIKASKIIIKPEEDGFISVKRKWYRGHFKVINDGLGLTVINDVTRCCAFRNAIKLGTRGT